MKTDPKRIPTRSAVHTALAADDVDTIDSALLSLRRATNLLEIAIVGLASDDNTVPGEDAGDALSIIAEEISRSERTIGFTLNGAHKRTYGDAR